MDAKAKWCRIGRENTYQCNQSPGGVHDFWIDGDQPRVTDPPTCNAERDPIFCVITNGV